MIAELLLNTIGRQSRGGVVFRPERCLRSRLNSDTCQRCLACCKSKALVLRGRRIALDEDRCTGCMSCVSECPNDALECDFDISVFLDALQQSTAGDAIVISCGKSSERTNHVKIPCIGLLSEPVLAALYCVVREAAYIDARPCVDCENGHVYNLVFERVRVVGEKYGDPKSLKLRFQGGENGNVTVPGGQRRAYLSMARNSMINIGRKVSTVSVAGDELAGGKEKSAEKGALRVTRFLQQVLDQLPENMGRERALLYSYFMTATVGCTCTLCPLCTGMCPTGALKRVHGSTVKQLAFTSAKCSGCGLCVAFCRKKALTLMPGVQSDPSIAQVIA